MKYMITLEKNYNIQPFQFKWNQTKSRLRTSGP